MTQGQIVEESKNVKPDAGRLVEAQSRVQAVNAGIPLITLLRREGWTEEEINQMLADKKKVDEESKRNSQALLDSLRVQGQQENSGSSSVPENVPPSGNVNASRTSTE